MWLNKMKVGDRVLREKVLKFKKVPGTIIKKTGEYVVIRWDNIPGEWHYTEEQSKKLEVIDE